MLYYKKKLNELEEELIKKGQFLNPCNTLLGRKKDGHKCIPCCLKCGSRNIVKTYRNSFLQLFDEIG